MLNPKADAKRDLLYYFVFVIVIALGGFISVLALTAGRGFDSELFKTRFYVYAIITIVGLLMIGAVKVIKFAFRKDVDIPLHDPEIGLFNFSIVRNPVSLIFFISMIVMLPLYFAGRYGGVFFSSVQQISKFGNLWSDSAFPVNENWLFMIPLGLILLATWGWKKKNSVAFWSFNLLVTPAVIAFLWLKFHNLVYGSDEVASLFTIIFGFVGIMMTVATMSVIPWAVLHFFTNFVLSAKRNGLFSNDFFIIELVVLEILLIAGFVWSLRFNKYFKS